MSPRAHWSEWHNMHAPRPTRPHGRQVTGSALQPGGLVAGLTPSRPREQVSRSISVALAAFSFCPCCPLGQGQGDTHWPIQPDVLPLGPFTLCLGKGVHKAGGNSGGVLGSQYPLPSLAIAAPCHKAISGTVLSL